MTIRMKGLLAAVACFAVAGALAACDSNASNEPKAPPPPPQIFTVIHKDLDGTVTTDRAIWYQATDGGCVYYMHPDDKARNINFYRLFCGGTTHVRPEER